MKFLKPKFWDKRHLTFQSIILYPFTFIIDIKEFFDALKQSKKYPEIKTICVGNIYLGGTGKTPLVAFIANKLNKKFKTTIIKKKYLDHLDEKILLEKKNNVFFKKDRLVSLLEAIKKKFELAIFDDGLQDKKIQYDLKIVCFNSLSLAGNQLRLPAGPLRERLESLKKYDAIFILGEKKSTKFLTKVRKIKPNIPIFSGEYIPTNFQKFKKKNHLIFSGIGNPDSFAKTLDKYNIRYGSNLIYPDHYNYTEKDMKRIKKLAKIKNLQILTTEKDYNRVPSKYKNNIYYLKVDLKIKKLKAFNKFIAKYL